jgi:hypothetical protein
MDKGNMGVPQWAALAASPAVWLACGSVWLLGVLAGVPVTLAACLMRAYDWSPVGGDRGEGFWFYTWRFMRHWSTYDNGACAAWYAREKAVRRVRLFGRTLLEFRCPLWVNCWVYSGFRNAFGGNPFNLHGVPDPEVRWAGSWQRLSNRMVNDRAAGRCRRLYWNVTSYKTWFCGVHVLIPFSTDPEAANSHFEIRHGWKLYPDASAYGGSGTHTAVFSLWDTGPRFR